MNVTTRGPTLQQVEVWTRELEGLQVSIHNSEVISAKVYVKALLNIITDLVESFRNPDETCCRRCGRMISAQTQAWDGLCQGCFDEIVGLKVA